MASLHWADFLIIALYFAAVVLVGLWATCRQNKRNLSGYFLAGRSMSWIPVGASLYVSNIGAEHFVGLAGTGAASGIAIAMFEISAVPLMGLLGWLFVPVYIASGVYTMPEYMGKRFQSTAIRIYLSVLCIVLYLFTKISVSIYAGSLFIQLATGWNLYLSIVVLLLITATYTILGGLAAVIMTDTLASFVILVGGIIVAGLGFNQIGGYGNLIERYMDAIPQEVRNNSNLTCILPRQDAFHLFRAMDADLPWLGLILQSCLGCIWYWCNDQVIVQRTLSAKNLLHAKGGSILCGYLKLLPLFIIVFPGMISRALWPDEIGCTTKESCEEVCSNAAGCTNLAFPFLIFRLLPVGLAGLLIAVILAAIMSSLTSIFNSSATIFSMDLWWKLRPNAKQVEILLVGKIFIVVLCATSVAWVSFIKTSYGAQLFIYINAMQAYLGSPIAALFLMAVLWKGMSSKGALFGIMTGHTAGIIRLILDIAYPSPECGSIDTRPGVIRNFHFTYFGTFSMFLVVVVAVLFTFLFPDSQHDDAQLAGVTWWTRIDALNNKSTEKELSDITSERTNNENEGMRKSEPATSLSVRLRSKRFWLDTLCGTTAPESNTATQARYEISLHENEKWRRILDANLVLMLIAMVTVCIIFG